MTRLTLFLQDRGEVQGSSRSDRLETQHSGPCQVPAEGSLELRAAGSWLGPHLCVARGAPVASELAALPSCHLSYLKQSPS